MSTLLTKETKRFSQVSTTSNTLQLVNNTDAALVMIDAYVSTTSPDEELYERSLQALSTTEGQKQVGAGETKTISLGEPHKDANGTALDYIIILARADNLFPVKLVTVTASLTSLTVTSADAANMKLAEKLKRYTGAFPSSAIAIDFAKLLESKDPEQATNFFAKYTDYSSVTIDMVVAVETYYTVYPFAWAGYAASKTYQLYTSDGNTNKKLATITLKNACVVPMSPDKSVGGFTATCTVAGVATPLVYSHGQFTNDASSTTPTICLQGLFTLKSQLTLKSTDNEIIPILTGTVNSQSVLAHDDTNEKSSSTLDKLLPPATLAGWLKFCGILVGGIIVVVILAKLLKKAVEAYRNRGKMTQEQWDKMQEDFLKQQSDAMKTNQEYLDRLKQREAPKLPDNFADFSEVANREAISITYESDLQHINDICTQQSRICKTALGYGNNTNLDKVSTSLKETKDWLKTNPDGAAVSKKLNEKMTEFKSNSELMAKEWAKIKNKQSADMVSVDEAQRTIDDITERVQENEKIRDDWREDNMPEDIIIER